MGYPLLGVTRNGRREVVKDWGKGTFTLIWSQNVFAHLTRFVLYCKAPHGANPNTIPNGEDTMASLSSGSVLGKQHIQYFVASDESSESQSKYLVRPLWCRKKWKSCWVLCTQCQVWVCSLDVSTGNTSLRLSSIAQRYFKAIYKLVRSLFLWG